MPDLGLFVELNTSRKVVDKSVAIIDWLRSGWKLLVLSATFELLCSRPYVVAAA